MASWTNRMRILLPLSLLSLLISASPVHAQEEIEPRVWSVYYWFEMAQQGLASKAPDVPVRQATFQSSTIDASVVFMLDSPDQPVTTDPNTTQSENSTFIHPIDLSTVLNSNNSTVAPPVPVGGVLGADAFVSTDGGANWTGSIQGVGGPNRGDPAAVISINGTFFVGYIAQDRGQGVARSTNGGATWTHIQVAPPPGNLLDKNHLWIDNSPSSAHADNLYSAWTRFEGGSPNDLEVELARSTNDGLTWSAPINISQGIANDFSQGVNIKTGPNGEVYVVWAIYDAFPSDEVAIGFARSTNGGQSFGAPVRIIDNIRGIRLTRTSKDMRVNSFPVMAVDISGGLHNGNIYVVWTNIGVPGLNQEPDIDIYMIRSINGGATWSTPIRVNQDPINSGNQHFFPWITCDPETGALSVIFYDDRNVGVDEVETYAAISFDAGTTWEDFRISDVSFTPEPIPGLAADYFGDYLGISARGQQIYPMWTDNRSGRALTYVSPFTTLPNDLVLQSQTLSVSRTYRAQNSIEAGPAYTVSNSGDVTLLSGGEIRLKPGFTAVQGSRFSASIDPSLSANPAMLASVSSASHNETLNQSVEHGTSGRQAGLLGQSKVLEQDTPSEYHLFANYPNPFNPSTRIRYALKEEIPVTLKIFNVLGQEVRTLVDGVEAAGYKTVVWDGTDNTGMPVPSGVYIYRFRANQFSQSRTMILVK